MRRRSLFIASILGLICCGASSIMFALAPNDLSILWGAALFTLLAGLVASLMACLFAVRRFKSRVAVLPAGLANQGRRIPLLQLFGRQIYVRAVPVDTPEGRRWRLQSLKQLAGLLVVFLVLVVYVELLTPIMQRYVNSIHFGAFVALILLIFPLLALSYTLFSSDGSPSEQEGPR